MNKIGIVLSGGGARGFAHLGMLKALEEYGIKPYAVSGVSAGAIVGALYAAGHKPDEILTMMKTNNYFKWSELLFRKDGVLSMEPLLNALKKYIPEDSFESLATKLYVTATDFTNAKQKIFSEGKLYQAVIASSSVPVIFQPVVFENNLHVDGGLLNNFPVEPLVGTCDKVIGSHVNNMKKDTDSVLHPGKINIAERSYHMAIANSVYSKVGQCDVFLDPVLQQYALFDIGHAKEMFQIGYETAKGKRDEILKCLE